MAYRRIYARAFLIPGLLIYGCLFVLPSIMGMFYAFTNWNVYSDEIRFVGLANFRMIFTTAGSGYPQVILNTLLYAVASAVLSAILGLLLALVMNTGIYGQSGFRSIFFLPQILSGLIISMVFTAVFLPKGLLNQILEALGLTSLTHSWLSDRKVAMGAVVAVEIWRRTGLNMIIFLAGLQTIPGEYYEAASIDGASGLQKFFYLTLTFILPSITINMVLNIINGFKAFDLVFTMTNGGPGMATEVLNTMVYREFASGHYGLSTALGMVMFVITTTAAFAVQKLMRIGGDA